MSVTMESLLQEDKHRSYLVQFQCVCKVFQTLSPDVIDTQIQFCDRL